MNRIVRVFTHSLPPESTQTLLEGETAHYLLKVLRVKTGQSLELFDGKGHSVYAEVGEVGRRELAVQTQARVRSDNRSTCLIVIGLGVIKLERFEWALQKLTELGVDEIQPIAAEFSDGRLVEGFTKKRERFEKILQAACEQSLRSHLPTLHDPQPLNAWSHGGAILAPGGQAGWPAANAPSAVLIGPEGGWSETELDTAHRLELSFIGLGPRILRAETAAIAAATLIQTTQGDWRPAKD